MKNSPFLLIGAITGRTTNNKLAKGSGALISANLVVTAAHVVINRK